jgi:hypothetical protein
VTALAWISQPPRPIPPPFDAYAKQTEWVANRPTAG